MASRGKQNDPLADYRAKRSADRTPEPFSGPAGDRPGLFVVHKHAARQLHYDLRLEMGGVLQSWAVPKGPSLDPEDKRLAMKVEDHPLEYAEFEGIIPEGNYGAGSMIVWDRGQWIPKEDPLEGLEKGKLLFDLFGHKLRGRWTLFRTKGDPKQWLMMKKPDGFAREGEAGKVSERSILSGYTVEELGEGADLAAPLRRKLRRWKTERGEVDPARVEPMLAAVAEAPFSRAGWVFEIKYDGYRLIAARRRGEPFLRYRRGQDVTFLFPEVAAALARLPHPDCVLDGEVVVLDEEGKPSFQRLQRRVQLKRPADIRRASVNLPATLFVFDLLAYDGFDLRPLPLTRRKEILEQILLAPGAIRYSEHIERMGKEMYAQAEVMRLEGLVAKRAGAPYQGRRSQDWLKMRVDRRGDFIIVGTSAAKGLRSGFGALHLAVKDGEALTYAGRVGTGFGEASIAEIEALLAPVRVKRPAFEGAPAGEEHSWVKPVFVCEVRYKEWTGAGHLRHPVFLGLRPDKEPADCALEGNPDSSGAGPPEPPEPELEVPQPTLTNQDKLFWPEDGYTKGDLVAYYRDIAPWILPYLRDRPVVLTRYPDGIHGKNFFQKDAPGFVPDWLRIETMWSEHAQREIHYFICDDEATLVFLANLGTIPLHVWSSRVKTLQSPDWTILDLDPKTAPFSDVVKLARAIRSLCEEIELESYIKTSGATGLHVLIPLGGQCTYDQSRMLAQLLARVVEAEHHRIATTARSLASRKGRVYLDFGQNGHGRLLVAPFSVRPLAGAPVSMPLRWSEVTRRLSVGRYTIKTAVKRMRGLQDPLLPVLEQSPDLGAALARLQERLVEGS